MSVTVFVSAVGKTSLITRFMYDSFDNTYQVKHWITRLLNSISCAYMPFCYSLPWPLKVTVIVAFDLFWYSDCFTGNNWHWLFVKNHVPRRSHGKTFFIIFIIPIGLELKLLELLKACFSFLCSAHHLFPFHHFTLCFYIILDFTI